MGIGVRIFIFEDQKDSLRRISLKKFDGLMVGERSIRFPEYAGQEKRCALIYLEFEQRKPVGVLRMEFNVIRFDRGGRRDRRHAQEARNLACVFLDPLLSIDEQHSNVVDIRPYLARKRYNEKFHWNPTDEQIYAVLLKAFGRHLPDFR